MLKNTAGQKIGCQMITAADGTPFTGSVTVYVTGDAGTQAVGSVSSGACTHEGEGYHTYAPAQAETNYDLVAFTFKGTGAINATVQVFTNNGDVAAIKAKTDNLPSDPADASDIAASFGAIDSKIDAIDNFIDTEVAAIKAVTDKLDTALVLDGSVYQFTANALELGPAGASVWTTAGADPLTTPAATASYGAKLDWILAMLKNYQAQTKTLQTVTRDDGTVISEAAVTSDGTTVTREKFANP